MVAAKKETPEKPAEITDEAPKNEDPTPEEAEEETEGEFAGQVLHGEHYAVETKEVFGRKIVEIKPIGWVGTGLEVSAGRAKEIARLIGKVSHLPKQD